MPTQQQVQTTILSAQYKLATLTQRNLTLILNGGMAIRENFINYFRLNLHGLQYQNNRGDYTSSTTVTIYNRLLSLIGIDTNIYSLDPNFQNPSTTIINPVAVVGYNINKYPFSTTDLSPMALFDNYHELYYPLYGNDPVLAMYVITPDYSGEEQTPPVITFATPVDSGTDIVSIQYNFPIGTAGELQMSGKAPNSGGSGSGGSGGSSGATVLTYSQINLQNAGTVDEPNWYLPINLPSGKNPVFVVVNGISIPSELDINISPNRLYGFANNDTQVIKVTII